MPKDNANYSFSDMKEFVLDRFRWARSTPIFLLYFGGIFLVLGTVGIWYPIAKNGYWIVYVFDELHPQNLLGFSMPVLATLLIDGILEISSKKKSNKTLASYGITVGVLALFLIGYGIIHSEKNFYLVSFAGWIIVLFLWFLFNAGNEKFEDKIDSGAPAAKDTPADTQHLNGKGVDGGKE